MANSKRIGGAYEREFSIKISKWLSCGESEICCYRDRSSGSRDTVRTKAGNQSNQNGDIVAYDPKYKYFFDLFYVDCKSYKEWNPIFINPKNQKSNSILNEWKIEYAKARNVNKIPMLPVKIRDSRTPQFILFPINITFHKSGEINTIVYNFTENAFSCCLVLQDDFFKNQDPDLFYTQNRLLYKKIV